ncbi:MAG: hypothetical protein ONB05_07760, partial [candidate division KSB1 bacterium]|nr:hypothetical protein [candidate division KSB1 bacterium]
MRRMGLVVSVALVFWLLLFIRLVQIQLINRGRYVNMAKTQYIQEVTLQSSRGIIYDRCLNCLAINKSAHSLGLDIRKVSEPRSVATKLARFLGKSEDYYYRELTSSKSFLWLAREIEEQEANKI